MRYEDLVSTEDAAVLSDAAQFAEDVVQKTARAVDERGFLGPQLLAEMGRRRYMGASLPREHGGLGLEPVAYGLLTEILGKVCANTKSLLTLQDSLIGESLLRWGTPSQVSAWIPRIARGEVIAGFGLTEPTIGSDASHPKTSYALRGDHFVLNGRKKWTTFGAIAHVYLIFAGSPERGVTAFLVERERPGVTVTPMSGLLGLRGTQPAEILLEDVEVPLENVVGGVGNGFKFVANTALDHGRYSIAWSGVGIASASVEVMTSYAREREQFGKPIHEHQLVQGLIGDATMYTHAAKALCLRAGQLRRDRHADAVVETTVAKYFSSVAALETASHAVQTLGGNGCYSEFPAERLFREAKVLQIIEGSTQIQQQLVSRFALQRYAKKGLFS